MSDTVDLKTDIKVASLKYFKSIIKTYCTRKTNTKITYWVVERCHMSVVKPQKKNAYIKL